MRTAIFLERDGILNLPKIEGQYQIAPRAVEDFVINKSALEPLKQLKALGFVLIATTNQPGISRGHLFRRDLDLMHTMLKRIFPLDDILMCPHDDSDRCPCRKPKPGLFREAAFSRQLDLDHSYVVSDKWQDAKAAQNVGCTSVLIKSPWNGSGHHDYVLNSLAELPEKIAQLQQGYTARMHEPELALQSGLED